MVGRARDMAGDALECLVWVLIVSAWVILVILPSTLGRKNES